MTTATVTGEFVEVDNETAKQLLANLKAAQAINAAGKAAVATAKSAILEAMMGCEVLVNADTKQELVVHRVVESNVFDATKFRKDYPGLVTPYMKTQTSRPFKVVA